MPREMDSHGWKPSNWCIHEAKSFKDCMKDEIVGANLITRGILFQTVDLDELKVCALKPLPTTQKVDENSENNYLM